MEGGWAERRGRGWGEGDWCTCGDVGEGCRDDGAAKGAIEGYCDGVIGV